MLRCWEFIGESKVAVDIFIFGTHHGYQYMSEEFTKRQHVAFSSMLIEQITANKIQLLSEESNEEALQSLGASVSALQIIAKQVHIEHLFTEATLEYRNANGMEQENYIRASGFLNNLTEEEMSSKIEHSYRIRERYWLQRIIEATKWPVLHVCGANHADPFFRLVSIEGLEASLLFQDWGN
jgi:Asp-tRNA(Asn)/Glu-tRNA(Gln) amidotransferase B subunit